MKVTKTERPLILVTNDDGVHALGMAALIDAISEFGDIVAVAPQVSQSGMSHALTLKTPLRLKKIRTTNAITIYELNGTPVDCVKMAFDKILPCMPQLLVSGINHGSNSSISSIYSGTVAAAREGAINSIPSIAFSNTNYADDADFEFMKSYIKQIVSNVLDNGLNKGTFLNVNAPHLDPTNIKGIKICKQAEGVWVEEFDQRQDPMGTNYYWLTGYFNNAEPDNEETDEWSLKNNYVTIVPLKFENCDHNEVINLRARFN
jgi:5'-nucleotidase